MRELSADGDTWRVTSSGDDPRRDVRTVVFHCLSNTQRPYRVVEIPPGLLGGRDLEGIADDELSALFDRTHTMDYSHDTAASPLSHGYGDPPLE
ncbi:hypothetical protein BH23GEM9_BH23GEM9_01920 [soil metagenome]